MVRFLILKMCFTQSSNFLTGCATILFHQECNVSWIPPIFLYSFSLRSVHLHLRGGTDVIELSGGPNFSRCVCDRMLHVHQCKRREVLRAHLVPTFFVFPSSLLLLPLGGWFIRRRFLDCAISVGAAHVHVQIFCVPQPHRTPPRKELFQGSKTTFGLWPDIHPTALHKLSVVVFDKKGSFNLSEIILAILAVRSQRFIVLPSEPE